MRSVKAMAYDPLTDFLYWIEGSKNSFRRAKAEDGSGVSGFHFLSFIYLDGSWVSVRYFQQ